MSLLRAFLYDHRRLAAMLVVMALAMKALVPAGYMIGQEARVLTVQVCADAQGGQMTMQIVVPNDVTHSGHEAAGKSSGNACAFTALGLASLAGADIVLLAGALVFILALGFAPMPASRFVPARHILPPLRGPPALA